MNSFTILEEYNEVVDEFLYNIRGIEWGSRWIPYNIGGIALYSSYIVKEFIYYLILLLLYCKGIHLPPHSIPLIL
jgi:hypothetical protein